MTAADRPLHVVPPSQETTYLDLPTNDAPDNYMITIRGCLGPALSGCFAPLTVNTGDGRTELRGHVQDQGALYGILARIQSLGLQLDEVVRLSPAPARRPAGSSAFPRTPSPPVAATSGT